MAHAPAFVKGALNLRGVIVPIVDMRMKFNLEQVNYDDLTVVIMLNIGTRVIGIVVDGHHHRAGVAASGAGAVFNDRNEHLLALGALDDRMLILLDIVTLMRSADMGLIFEAVHLSISGPERPWRTPWMRTDSL